MKKYIKILPFAGFGPIKRRKKFFFKENNINVIKIV
jgi:hypothetical protein